MYTCSSAGSAAQDTCNVISMPRKSMWLQHVTTAPLHFPCLFDLSFHSLAFFHRFAFFILGIKLGLAWSFNLSFHSSGFLSFGFKSPAFADRHLYLTLFLEDGLINLIWYTGTIIINWQLALFLPYREKITPHQQCYQHAQKKPVMPVPTPFFSPVCSTWAFIPRFLNLGLMEQFWLSHPTFSQLALFELGLWTARVWQIDTCLFWL